MPNNHLSLKKGGFTFKHFFVAHDKSPMKVTTDSCLLGACAPITHAPKQVLDIGTGCGVIALMLAARLINRDCQIDAIDIDKQAVNQCQQNAFSADFSKVNAIEGDINQFRIESSGCYDLIVTNPPYFESAVDCRDRQRQLARYTESLSYQQLLDVVKRLLSITGRFCLVLPYHLSNQFKLLAKSNHLYLQQELKVKYSANKSFSLSLMTFAFQPCDAVLEQHLCMRDEDGRYSDDFRALLVDFYLFRK